MTIINFWVEVYPISCILIASWKWCDMHHPFFSEYTSIHWKIIAAITVITYHLIFNPSKIHFQTRKLETRYWEFTCRKVQRLTIGIPCYYSYWFRIWFHSYLKVNIKIYHPQLTILAYPNFGMSRLSCQITLGSIDVLLTMVSVEYVSLHWSFILK